jgi:hypothetical protein
MKKEERKKKKRFKIVRKKSQSEMGGIGKIMKYKIKI